MDNGVVSLASRRALSPNGHGPQPVRVSPTLREWDVDAACRLKHHCRCGGAAEVSVALLTIRFDALRQRLDVTVLRDGDDIPRTHRTEFRPGETEAQRLRREAVMDHWHGVLADAFGWRP